MAEAQMQLSLRSWRASILSLGFEIRDLCYGASLLPESATARGEYFFSDHGVPRPRPCTALAWASLCAFGPIQGFISFRNGLEIRHPFNLCRGRFLLPFLPKIIRDEESNLSLIRTSKAHHRDESDRIIWGPIFIADSSTGQILEQWTHGQRVAKEWMDSHPADFIWPFWEGQHIIPPLYAEVGMGWQFGIIQTMASIAITLRDPMIALAQNGIMELTHGGKSVPKIRRLLFRFLDSQAARGWATAYAESMRVALDEAAVLQDRLLLSEQIQKRAADSIAEASAPKTRNKFASDSFLTDFLSGLAGTNNENKTGTK